MRLMVAIHGWLIVDLLLRRAPWSSGVLSKSVRRQGTLRMTAPTSVLTSTAEPADQSDDGPTPGGPDLPLRAA